MAHDMTAYRGETPAYTEIPSDEQVIAALRALGGSATAAVLCDELVAGRHPRRDSQLAIQRALERGHLAVGPNWTMVLVERAAAAA